MKVRLTDWATRQGIAYVTAVRWAKAGKIPALHQAASGRLFVEVPDIIPSVCARIYRHRSGQTRADRAVAAASGEAP